MSTNCPECGFPNPEGSKFCEKCGCVQDMGPNPQLAEEYATRAFKHSQNGNLELALEEYSKSIKLHPNNSSYYFQRGCTYIGLSKRYYAIQDFQTALKINPNHANSHSMIGNEYLIQGDYDRAFYHLTKAIDLKNQLKPFILASTYMNRAIVFGLKGKKNDYKKDLDSAKKIDPLIEERLNLR